MSLEKFSIRPEDKTEVSVHKNELEGPYADSESRHNQGKYHTKDSPSERYHQIRARVPLQIMATRLLKGILPVADIVKIEGEKQNGLSVYASKEAAVEAYNEREIVKAAKADMFIIAGIFGDWDHNTNNLRQDDQYKHYYHYDFGQVSSFDQLVTDEEKFRDDTLERWVRNYDEEHDLNRLEFRAYILKVLDQIEARLTPTEEGETMFDTICDSITREGADMYKKEDPLKMEMQTNDPDLAEILGANPIYTTGEDLITELGRPELRNQYREWYLFRIAEMRKYLQSYDR